MTHRREFLKQVAAIAGASGLGGLLAIDEALGRELSVIEVMTRQSSSDFAWLRDRYMLNPDVTYFNHGSIGTIPRVVHEAQAGYLEVCETNPWLYMWGDGWEKPRERVRGKAARLLKCAPDEVALTHNTTEGFNTLANGLALGPGDEVVFSSLNHDGASVCWFHYAQAKGFEVKRFEFPLEQVPRMSASELLDIYDRHITRATKVLVFPHIDNMVGIRHPVKELVTLAKSRGVEIVAVDGAQSVGMLDVDVSDLGADVYCTSPHKWLQAPKGLGLMHVRPEVREVLRPMWVTWGQKRWEGSVRIFEDYGTRNLPDVLALGDAIDFQVALGAEAKAERYRALWDEFRTATRLADNVIWRSPEVWELSASLFALEVKGHRSRAVFDLMYGEHGFVFRPFDTQGLNTIRISPNIFNTEEEIGRFFEALPT